MTRVWLPLALVAACGGAPTPAPGPVAPAAPAQRPDVTAASELCTGDGAAVWYDRRANGAEIFDGGRLIAVVRCGGTRIRGYDLRCDTKGYTFEIDRAGWSAALVREVRGTTTPLRCVAGDGLRPPRGPACTRDADCGDLQACGFALADGCHATGECVPRLGPLCNSRAPACTCAGQTIEGVGCDGLTGGFAAAPLTHTGACP